MIVRLVDLYAGPPEVAAPFRDPSRWEHLPAELGRSEWCVDLVLVDDDAVAQLNHSYRRRAEATDVLSFAYLLPAGPGKPDLARGERGAAVDLWVDPLTRGAGDEAGTAIGEVLIAPSFVADRCRVRGWPLEHELPLLVVHGCLHLLGWEHERVDERARMRALETEVLAAAGLPHPLADEQDPETTANGETQ